VLTTRPCSVLLLLLLIGLPSSSAS
jgi:hypothetical protein